MASQVNSTMVREAIDLVLPYARKLCENYPWCEDAPRGVVFVVDGETLQEPIIVQMVELGPQEDWRRRYGYDFLELAKEKAMISLRTGRPSHDVQANSPWLLCEGDSVYGGAVAEDTSLVVSVSGSHEWADIAIAWTVFNTIAGLCSYSLELARSGGGNTI